MNADIKAKWVAALRSGEYKQGREFHRTGKDTYCPLGVLFDAMGLKAKRLPFRMDGSLVYYYPDAARIARKCRLRSLDATVVAAENDVAGKSFKEIADFIERFL